MTLPAGNWHADPQLPVLTEPGGEPASAAPRRGVRVLTLAVLFVVGIELGLFGAFFTLTEPHLLGVPIPVGPIIGLVGDLAVGLWTVRAIGTRLAVVAPAIGWIFTVLPLSQSRPEGDLVITNDAKGLAFLLLGSLAWAFAAVLGRPAAPPPPRGG